jgi:hypothetical protein
VDCWGLGVDLVTRALRLSVRGYLAKGLGVR